MKAEARPNGLALVWKPAGPGSQEVLFQLKKQLGLAGKDRQGLGHTGTLDPFAEGILLCGVGEGTKILSPLNGLPKSYEVTMLFGVSSVSCDHSDPLLWPESEAQRAIDDHLGKLSEEGLAAFLKSKVGAFEQIPPPQSAVRIDGKRAYEWAHKGIEKELKARPAEILQARHESLRETEFEGRDLLAWDFEVTVSSGTYIRALARDWGAELVGSPGLLTRLVRTAVGPFTMDRPPHPVSRGRPTPAPHMGGHGAARPGEGNEGLRVNWLGAADLEPLFDRLQLPQAEAIALKSHGAWDPRRLNSPPKPCLLQGPDGATIAFTEAGSGRIGRVFLEDPFGLKSPPNSDI